MAGMPDLAEAVVKELRAGDGDLDVYVVMIPRKGYCSHYKIQPTIRNGTLMWAWYGGEYKPGQDPAFKVVFDNVEDVIVCMETEFPGGGRLLIVSNGRSWPLFQHDIPFWYDEEDSKRQALMDKLKKFLMRCPKIENIPIEVEQVPALVINGVIF